MRYINFSGRRWIVKEGRMGPGPNDFSADNVWVDEGGNLHLKVQKINGIWNCAEVWLTKSLGYGTYEFEVEKPRLIDKNVILGLFTYENDTREIDIEFSRWGRFFNKNAQFCVQPYYKDENMHRFWCLAKKSLNTIKWASGRIFLDTQYKTWFFKRKKSWDYVGIDNPPAGKERIHLNLWIRGGAEPKKEVEVVIKSFKYRK